MTLTIALHLAMLVCHCLPGGSALSPWFVLAIMWS